MKPKSLTELQEFVKANFDKTHYEKYIALIEPNIENIIRKYFGAWTYIESYVTQIIMRINGAYKTSLSMVFDEDDDETTRKKYADKVDLQIYKKFELYPFKKKINYLLDKKIIGKNTHALLDHIRKKRNKIHKFHGFLSDEDRQWFDVGLSIIENIYFAVSDPDFDESTQEKMFSNAETSAKKFLDLIKTQK